MYRSSDLLSGPIYKKGSIDVFMENINNYLQECIGPLFYAGCGSHLYRKMRTSFRASALSEKEEDGVGFHTAHAIVYNDVVHQHMDNADYGYCVITCEGSFDGGHLYLPEIDMGFL
jgi:hypothetical protein